MWKLIDQFLNKITMYRLTLYYLIGLVVVAFCLSLVKLVSFAPLDILLGTALIVVTSLIANTVFAKLFHAVTNIESVFITALILVLIVPLTLSQNAIFLVAVSILAMASKYLFTIEKRHILNPAAAAVVVTALLTNFSASWWVGTKFLLPFVILGGILLVRKIQRFKMLLIFFVVYFLIISVDAFMRFNSLEAIGSVWKATIFDSAVFFFAFVMLTEPLTSPTTKELRGYYAVLTAVFYSMVRIDLFHLGITPEIALCVGNIFTYFASPNYRLVLTLKEKRQIATDTYAFIFEKPAEMNFKFTPGQYMEWTLMHDHVDDRGNRRYFSLASSPTEPDPMIMMRFYEPPSSYKKALLEIQPGQSDKKMIAASLAGDFTLPKNFAKMPLVFVAGGVGIAPFRSMIKYIVDKKIPVDIVVFFANKRVEDIVFAEDLAQAEPYGVRTGYILTDRENLPTDWQGLSGHLTAEMITKYLPDYATRTFYLSGPQLMVQSFEQLLKDMHLPAAQIKTDFFPGY